MGTFGLEILNPGNTPFPEFLGIQEARYGAILADPPWPFTVRSPKGEGRSADRHCRSRISIEEIARTWSPPWLPRIRSCPSGSWSEAAQRIYGHGRVGLHLFGHGLLRCGRIVRRLYRSVAPRSRRHRSPIPTSSTSYAPLVSRVLDAAFAVEAAE